MKRNEGLSARQKRFIAALLASATLTEAAERAGVSPVTAWRYLKAGPVREELGRRSDAVLAQAEAAFLSDVMAARQTLREIMTDRGQPASQRIRAAIAILDYTLNLYEVCNLSVRLEQLEQRLADMNEGGLK